jgi:hypothetical protein
MNNATHILQTISELNAPTLARMITRTEVKMNKKDVETKTTPNPFGTVYKITTQIVELAPKYESAVNDQLSTEGKEASFEASERKWGTNKGNGIVENNGKTYVSFIAKEHVLTSYIHNDVVIDKKEFVAFVPVKKPSATQGTDKEVVFRSVSLENIMSVEII